MPPHALSVSDEAIFDILKVRSALASLVRPVSCEQKFFGHNSFRGPQLDIIHAAIAGQDTFVCMATGSGKSLCYQLPAIALRKTVIVISPLISLMQDQVPYRCSLLHLTMLGGEAAKHWRQLVFPWKRAA